MGYSIPENIQCSVFKRQNEFAAGRLCAINALRILTGEFRQDVAQDSLYRPVWPQNIVGSISHSDNYAVALVSYKTNVLSVGIDIEEIDSVSGKIESILSLVITDTENKLLNNFDIYNANNFKKDHLLYLMFSAKESLFKYINPLHNKTFEFKDVEVEHIDFDNKFLIIKLLKNLEASVTLQKGTIFYCTFSYLFADQVIYTQIGQQ